MDEKTKLRMIKNRVKALYHNCQSSACFALADADYLDNETEAIISKNKAEAYETLAGWLKGLIDIM